jgi:hypothetical protein
VNQAAATIYSREQLHPIGELQSEAAQTITGTLGRTECAQ